VSPQNGLVSTSMQLRNYALGHDIKQYYMDDSNLLLNLFTRSWKHWKFMVGYCK